MISTPSSCSDSLRRLRGINILRHVYQTTDILFYVLRYKIALMERNTLHLCNQELCIIKYLNVP